MLNDYNWKNHYADNPKLLAGGSDYQEFGISNETGTGKVSVWNIFPGVQVLLNDLNMHRCAAPVIPRDDVIEIVYCLAGKYECEVSEQYCFYVSAGDLSVGTAGRIESYGGFPDGRFRGVSFLIRMDVLAETQHALLEAFGIDLKRIKSIAESRPHYFIIRNNPEVAAIFRHIDGIEDSRAIPVIRIRLMELLIMLSDPEVGKAAYRPVYVSRKQARIAKKIYDLITADITEHRTIDELAEELGIGRTALKTAFRNVYGMSVYAFQKDLRMKEARRLLDETDMSVADIAAAAGYVNPGKFTSAFRGKYGTTPVKYRNNGLLEH